VRLVQQLPFTLLCFYMPEFIHLLHRIEDITFGAGLTLFFIARSTANNIPPERRTVLMRIAVVCIGLWLLGGVVDVMRGFSDGKMGIPFRP
jgi:hypothetical protein